MSAPAPLIDRASRVQRATTPLATEVQGKMVMMDVEKGVYFALDVIGTDIWHRLAQPVLVTDLVAGLERDYDAPADTIERDVLAPLSRMVERGLVVSV